ncbi:uncharacterized protein LOC115755095 [Rhodamnia argentea]|uniref:Uncharacterized protein LOC115755095 isoform X1 n=1 Tax=Rhodamnia argentea TaxID=178133 RepID=A0A8B8QVA0_9MYRT|nr:uncharacterized protein LOC115755095 [Rhodamnia argentea]XP_030550250.1 uncharacterized protein LOC115755095 [Rhodamnia argentea]XP_030550259.1 uncharacterized protein LOC115755095 [Rhodamnia argentea]
MAGAGPNERTTRRLPRWMVAPPANDQARESGCRDSNTVQINRGVVSPQGTNSKSLTTQPKRASSLQGNYSSRVGGFGLVECGRKKRKRRVSEQEDGSDVSTHEIVEDRKEHRRGRRKAHDSVLQKRRKTKSPVAEGDEELTTFASDDDVELTVEDLMSIAEEIIASNKDVEQQRQHLGRSETSMRGSGNVKQYSLDAGAIHNEILDEAKHKNNSNGVQAGEETIVSIKGTGDPAREMLDLFLGPWLRKPVEEEKMSQFVADEVISMQDQKKESHGVVSAEAASPLKKKSSLKDKVAMFF